MVATELALAPLALTLTPRSATLPRSIATLVWTQRAAGTATTASTRLTSGMVATECAQRTATGRPRTGATWVPTQTAAGWATGARTRAWEAALHPWEDQSWHLVRTSALTWLGLRSAVPLRSLAIQATLARDAGLETTASIPSTPGTAALACAAPCATGTPRNGVTWALTPTDAGWATGASPWNKAAALMSTW